MHFIIFDISRVLVIFIVTFRIFVPHFPFRKTSFSMKSEMKNQNFGIKFCLLERARRCGHFGGADSI
tara:strand:- start:103 stop:303 length:201 start_codon:yes stop_codon:yes gene_type:complete